MTCRKVRYPHIHEVVAEIFYVKCKRKYVGVYKEGVEALLRKRAEFVPVPPIPPAVADRGRRKGRASLCAASGTVGTMPIQAQKAQSPLPTQPKMGSPRFSSTTKGESFMDKVTTMLGFAEKTISALSKQPLKLSFVASYSADEDHFNTALKVTTKGMLSPQKTYYETTAGSTSGVRKPRTTVPMSCGECRSSHSTNRRSGTSSPASSPFHRSEAPIKKSLQRTSKSISRRPPTNSPVADSLSGYMLENGIPGSLVAAKVQYN